MSYTTVNDLAQTLERKIRPTGESGSFSNPLSELATAMKKRNHAAATEAFHRLRTAIRHDGLNDETDTLMRCIADEIDALKR